MTYEYIRTEQVGRVRRFILNRPQARNAQSRRLTEELDDAFQAAEDDLGTGVVVLMGEGDHFSAGHDLGTPQEIADREARPTQGGVRGRYGRSYDLNIEAPALAEFAQADNRRGPGLLSFPFQRPRSELRASGMQDVTAP